MPPSENPRTSQPRISASAAPPECPSVAQSSIRLRYQVRPEATSPSRGLERRCQVMLPPPTVTTSVVDRVLHRDESADHLAAVHDKGLTLTLEAASEQRYSTIFMHRNTPRRSSASTWSNTDASSWAIGCGARRLVRCQWRYRAIPSSNGSDVPHLMSCASRRSRWNTGWYCCASASRAPHSADVAQRRHRRLRRRPRLSSRHRW